MVFFDVLELRNEEWELSTTNLDCPSVESLPKVCYVFPDKKWDKKAFSKDGLDRRHFLQDFEVPSLLFSSACYDGNGYFGYEPIYGQDDKLKSCNIWFRSLVKLVCEGPLIPSKDPKQKESKKPKKGSPLYVWHEMTFFTRWKPDSCVTLCIDTPADMPFELKAAMANDMRLKSLAESDPFAMYVPLMDHLIKLYDESVWSMRNMVRPIEKEREEQKDFEFDFSLLQEISRHSIHVGEVLAVTIDTASSLRESRQTLLPIILDTDDQKKLDQDKTNLYLRFQTQILKNFKWRQQSNHDRLQAEITLAYNMITQHDSRILKTDSKAMKTVAILTMIYLPGTFTSAIFGMNFFDFSSSNGTKPEKWDVSHDMWIFWLVACVLTAATIIVWIVWQYFGSVWENGKAWKDWGERRQKKRLKDEEK